MNKHKNGQQRHKPEFNTRSQNPISPYQHINLQELLAFQTQQINAETTAQIQAHLDICLICERRLQRIAEGLAEVEVRKDRADRTEPLEYVYRALEAEEMRLIAGESELDLLRPMLAGFQTEVAPTTVGELLNALRDGNADRFLAAAASWEQMDKTIIQIPDILPTLIVRLQDADWRVRETSAWMLGEIGSAAAVDSLATLLDDPDQDVRIAAALSLSQIGGAVAEQHLLQALGSSNWRVRDSVVRGVALALPIALSDPLAKSLYNCQNDPHPQVRLAADEALDAIKEARVENNAEPQYALESEPLPTSSLSATVPDAWDMSDTVEKLFKRAHSELTQLVNGLLNALLTPTGKLLLAAPPQERRTLLHWSSTDNLWESTIDKDRNGNIVFIFVAHDPRLANRKLVLHAGEHEYMVTLLLLTEREVQARVIVPASQGHLLGNIRIEFQ